MKVLRRLANWMHSNVDSRIVGAVLRSMGLLYHPLDDRLEPREAVRRAWRRPLFAGIGWLHVFGPVGLFLVFVLAGTGILLAFHYEPHPESGRQSVVDVTTEIPVGWLIRGIHHWAGELLVLFLVLHVLRAFFARAYSAPRQANWIVGLLILPVILSFHFTGTLLPWDQWAYWSAVRAVDLGTSLPLLGPFFGSAGPTDIATGVLGRAFVLHVILLPWLLFFLLTFHLRLVWRHGISPPAARHRGEPVRQSALVVLRIDATEAEAASVRKEAEAEGARIGTDGLEGRTLLRIDGAPASMIEKLTLDPRVKEVVALNPETAARTFFPHQFLRVVTVVLLVAGTVVLLAAWLPPSIAAPHDPFDRPDGVSRPWYVLWYEALQDLLPGTGGSAALWILFLLAILAFLWPLLDVHDGGRPRRPWLAPVAGAAAVAALVALTLLGARLS